MSADSGESPPALAVRGVDQPGTRQKILDTAIDLFSKKGYEAVSMQDIAAAVGIRKSSIYSHFKGKDEILQNILSFFITELAKAGTKDETALIETYLGTLGPAGLMAAADRQFEDRLQAPRLRKVWRMIAMEVYRNAMIRSFFEREMLEKPARFWEKAFRAMMDRGMIRRTDPVVLAREYHAFHVYTYLRYLLLFSDDEAEKLQSRTRDEGTAHIKFFLEMLKP
ncbi:MAG: DNA-binding transcriptional repressor AcrR [Methanocella sp. PtaU1.Bin125]|nr:MAG: DNA-binding transcriptional repressor AcrR [Methanocella sp. PtaU1.Bin125]